MPLGIGCGILGTTTAPMADTPAPQQPSSRRYRTPAGERFRIDAGDSTEDPLNASPGLSIHALFQEGGGAESVNYLIESIARAVQRTAPRDSDPDAQNAPRRHQIAERLHSLAPEAGREALAEAVLALKELVHDFLRLRERCTLLATTSASAYSALNANEHRLIDLQGSLDRLLGTLAGMLSGADSGLTATIQNRQAGLGERMQAAETALSALAGGAVQLVARLDPSEIGQMRQELLQVQKELATTQRALTQSRQEAEVLRQELDRAREVASTSEHEGATARGSARLARREAELRLRDAEHELAATHEQLAQAEQTAQEAVSRAAAIDAERSHLRGELDAALRRLAEVEEAAGQATPEPDPDQERIEVERDRLRTEVGEVRAALGRVEVERDRLRSRSEELAQAVASARAEAARLNAALETLRTEARSEHDRALALIRTERGQDAEKLRLLEDELARLTEDRQRLAQECLRHLDEITALQARPSAPDQGLAEEVAALRSALEEAQVARAEAETTARNAEERARQAAEEVAALHGRLAEEDVKHRHGTEAIVRDRDQAALRSAELAGRLAAAEEGMARLRREGEEMRQEAERWRCELNDRALAAETEVGRLRSELEGQRHEAERLRSEGAERGRTADDLQSDLARLREELARTRTETERQLGESAAVAEARDAAERARAEAETARLQAERARTEAEQAVRALSEQLHEVEGLRHDQARDFERRLQELGEEAAAARMGRERAEAALAAARESGEALAEALVRSAAAVAASCGAVAAILDQDDAAPRWANAAARLAEGSRQLAAADPAATGERNRLLAALVEAHNAPGEATAALARACAESRREASERLTALQAAEGRLATLEGELARQAQHAAGLQAQLEGADASGQAARAEAAAARLRIESLLGDLDRVRSEAATQAERARIEAERLATEGDGARLEAARLAGELAAAGTRLAGLEEALGRSRDAAVALLRLARALANPVGEPTGELGRLLAEWPDDPLAAGQPGFGDELAAAVQAAARDAAERLASLGSELDRLRPELVRLEQALALEQHQRLTAEDDLGQARRRGEGLAETLAARDAELEATRTQAEERARELAARHQELSALACDLAAVRREAEVRGAELAARIGIESELADLKAGQTALAARASEARQAVLALLDAVKALGVRANDQVDRFGLLLPTDTRRVTRATVRMEQVPEGEAPAFALAFGRELCERVGGQLAGLGDRLHAIEAERLELRDLLASAERDLAAARGESVRLGEALAGAEAKLAELESLRPRLAETQERGDALQSELTAERQARSDETRRLAAELAEARGQAEAAATGMQERLEEARAALAESERARAALAARLDEAADRLTGSEAAAVRRAQELEQALQERDTRLGELLELVERLRSEHQETVGLQARIRALNDRLGQAARDQARLESALAGHSGPAAAEREARLQALERAQEELTRRLRLAEQQLTDERARVEAAARTRAAELREWQARQAGTSAALEAERERTAAAEAGLRSLSAELAGARARLRSLAPPPATHP